MFEREIVVFTIGVVVAAVNHPFLLNGFKSIDIEEVAFAFLHILQLYAILSTIW